ncbi:Inositol 2-dehydrogenase/D-chiro-inositol 3-dehydrogenase [Roseimaritima multifibrata]|uniref:Inositol 2-dehydrogenase/D-chiro-inositol 3-dehydrogenase n=1 Tax=Roseimaritima multifibrata TaxID=1930274 RepID=A0A517MAX5_9BACT|nr:Gfo/Idh/MocA family oxidoreductase [Roseimaritima multifibrata]QDS92038.1 Inositol 2-dehydrogenase/D-chiro-inositol 3-dehydrogenase [Roseimaritima multifibrata]
MSNRREFIKRSGQAAAIGAMVTGAARQAHAAEDNTIQIALVGCGGRGTGAAQNALSVDNGPIKLVAMADVFEKNLRNKYEALHGVKKFQARVDVPEERRFLGFEAYREAMDCLRPGDIVILATPPAFRWVQYKYAIEKGLNVFMEKPVTIDGPTSLRMLDINKKAVEKNLKVAVGLMCRHCRGRRELFDRIQDGQIGELNMLRAYRLAGPTASAAVMPKPDGISELMYQIKNFHGFLWLSGGAVSDFLIHNIDEGCWMKNDWPVKAMASGGRHYRGEHIDQNFDSYAMEFTFADGAKLMVDGRTIPGCKQEFATFAHGSKGSAIVSTAGHLPAKSRIFKNQDMRPENMTWEFPQPEPNPYQLEWDDLIAAVRNDETYNEVERGVMASAVASLGRMAAHTGQEITLDQFLNCEHEFAPGIESLTLDGPSPLQANAEGKYPVPMPGLVKKQEYLT